MMMVKICLMMVDNISGWWLTYPSNDGVKVSWDDDIPN
jgi:hypothetical protein